MAFSNIDQETGANSPLSANDYQNNPTRNYLPIAFRKVSAFRLSSAYERESAPACCRSRLMCATTAWICSRRSRSISTRRSSTTENQSVGLLAKWRRDFAPMRARLILGADFDLVRARAARTPSVTTTRGAAPCASILQFSNAGAHLRLRRDLPRRVPLRARRDLAYRAAAADGRAALRSPQLRFRQQHRGAGLDSSGRRDLYSLSSRLRPGSRHRPHVQHWSPKLGATYALAANTHMFVSYTHGFRAPSEGDLFRPAFGANAAEAQAAAQGSLGLKPIKADQVEAGLRGLVGRCRTTS